MAAIQEYMEEESLADLTYIFDDCDDGYDAGSSGHIREMDTSGHTTRESSRHTLSTFEDSTIDDFDLFDFDDFGIDEDLDIQDDLSPRTDYEFTDMPGSISIETPVTQEEKKFAWLDLRSSSIGSLFRNPIGNMSETWDDSMRSMRSTSCSSESDDSVFLEDSDIDVEPLSLSIPPLAPNSFLEPVNSLRRLFSCQNDEAETKRRGLDLSDIVRQVPMRLFCSHVSKSSDKGEEMSPNGSESDVAKIECAPVHETSAKVSSAEKVFRGRNVVKQRKKNSSKRKKSTNKRAPRDRRKDPAVKVYVNVTENDVLFGRGGLSNHHKGNKKYRRVVLQLQPGYKLLSTRAKTTMSAKVVQDVIDSGGRFLKRDDSDKQSRFFVVTAEAARQKVAQALREDHTDEGRQAKRARTETSLSQKKPGERTRRKRNNHKAKV